MAKYTQIFIRKVPVSLKEQFKAYCAVRGMNMTSMLVEMMQSKVDEHNRLVIQAAQEVIRENHHLRPKRFD